MRYNEVGKTGIRLSEVSFGAGSAAGLMINGTIEEQVAAVRAALDAGINHFDTAAFYGYGASEIYLGQALRAAGARDALVTSKVAIGREFLTTGELRRCVRQSVEQSLSRLRRDAIDFLLVHNATHRGRQPYDPERESVRVARIMNDYIPAVTFDDVLGNDGIYEEVECLQQEGKVRCFGLSGQNNDPMVTKAIVASGRIAVFNQPYNLLNPSAGLPAARGHRRITGGFAIAQRELFIEFDDVIESARAAGVAVSVISPMAAGALTAAAERGDAPAAVSRRANRFPFEGQFDRMVALARRFKPIAQRAGVSLTELAVQFVLSTPGVTTMVVGLSNADQVRQAVAAAEKRGIDEAALEACRAVWFGPGLD